MTTKAYEIGQFGISLVVTDAGEITALSINTNQVTEGTNNKYYTDARVRAAISASGSLNYNSSTGAITYTGVNLRYAGQWDYNGDGYYPGDIVRDDSNNLYIAKIYVPGTTAGLNDTNYWQVFYQWSASNTDLLTEGSTNLYHTTARVRSALSGSTIIAYNSTTGAIDVNDASIGVSKFDATVANTFSTKGTSIAMAIALG